MNYTDQQISKLRRIVAGVLITLGAVAMLAAASIFQGGTHASMYGSVFGALMVLVGSSFLLKKLAYWRRLLAYFGIFILMVATLLGFDYLSVRINNVPPRFTYAIITWTDMIYYDTPFYDVVRCNPDTENESWRIIDNTDYDEEKVAEWNYCSANE